MIFVYAFICVALIILSKSTYKRLVNPIAIFVLPWLLLACGYELKLIQYYDLTITTYMVIIFTVVLYSVGAVLGSKNGKITTVKITVGKSTEKVIVSKYEYKKKIQHAILITSIIGGVSTILAMRSIIGR